MHRGSAIAVVGAVTGILIAGSVASVAVINAASSSTTTEPAPIVAASVQESESSQVVQPAPNASSTPLPEIIVPEPIEPTADPTPSAKAATPSPTEPRPQTISADQARQAATNATGGTVLSTTRVERGGYDAFAVQIQRADSSIVTGFVEASTGVVFDWVVDEAAPTPSPAATYEDDYDDEYGDDDEYEDDDYEDDDDDDDDDNDNDDDDDREDDDD
jgi:hypothetical protein